MCMTQQAPAGTAASPRSSLFQRVSSPVRRSHRLHTTTGGLGIYINIKKGFCLIIVHFLQLLRPGVLCASSLLRMKPLAHLARVLLGSQRKTERTTWNHVHGIGKETLPKAQRTRGLSSSYQSNFLRSYHEFKHKS